MNIAHLLQKYSEVFENHPEARNCREAFFSQLTAIREAMDAHTVSLKGYTLGKQQAKSSLLQVIRSVANVCMMYFDQQEDQIMLGKYKEYLSPKAGIRDQALMMMARNLILGIQDHTAGLEAYGLNQDKLDELQLKYDRFMDFYSETGLERKERKALTMELKLKFQQMMALLNNRLDKYVRFVSGEFPEFATLYFYNRKATPRKRPDDTSSEFCELFGMVTESGSGNAIANAVVQIPGESLNCFTDKDGCYVFEGIPKGEYTLLVFKPGYVDVQQTIDLDNEQNQRDFELSAIALTA